MPRQARVGLLVIVGALIFLGALFLLAQQTFLFSETYYVRTRFNDVAGLIPGANVNLQGVNVGRVEEVALPSRPGGPIEVLLAINQDAAEQVRRNTKAAVQSDGLVGNMIISLVPNKEAPGDRVPEGDYIQGVDPFSIAAVSERASASVDRLDAISETAGLIVQDVRNGEGSIGRMLYDPTLYNSFVRTAGETEALMATLNLQASQLATQTSAITASAQQVTDGLNSTLVDFNTRLSGTQGTVGAFLNDRTVYDRLVSSADSLSALSTNLRAITRNTEELTAWGALGAFRFSELMEAGKHNFLFKGYFERRGYQEQAPFEVRERALRLSQTEIERRQREVYDREQALVRREAAAGLRPAADTARAVGAVAPVGGG